VERISNKLQMNAKEAEKTIDEIDKQRENFTQTFADVSRYDARNYDMVFNISHVGADMIVNSIASYINENFKN
jgi:cytidylate kinase